MVDVDQIRLVPVAPLAANGDYRLVLGAAEEIAIRIVDPAPVPGLENVQQAASGIVLRFTAAVNPLQLRRGIKLLRKDASIDFHTVISIDSRQALLVLSGFQAPEQLIVNGFMRRIAPDTH